MNDIQKLTQNFMENVFSSPEYADLLFNYYSPSNSYEFVHEVSQSFTTLVSDVLSMTNQPDYESIYNAVKAIDVINKPYYYEKNVVIGKLCNLILSKTPDIKNQNNDMVVDGILKCLKTGEENNLSGGLIVSNYRSDSVQSAIDVLENHRDSYWFKTDLFYGFKMLQSLSESISFGCKQSEKSKDWRESYKWDDTERIFEHYSNLFQQDNSDIAKHIDYIHHTIILNESREDHLQKLGVKPFEIDVSHIIRNTKPLKLASNQT